MNALSPPVITLLGCAALAGTLEGLGAAPGERKRVPRRHHALLVASGALIAGLLSVGLGDALDPWRLWAILGSLVGFAACHGGGMQGERAALALTLGAAGLLALPADPDAQTGPAVTFAFAGVWAVIGAGLLVRAGRDDAVEAAAKHAFSSAAGVILLGLGLVIDASEGPGVEGLPAIGAAAGCGGLALLLGLWPLHGHRLDVLQGGPAGLQALGAIPVVVLAPGLMTRLVVAAHDVALALAVIILLGLPVVALSQRAIRRITALSSLGQLGLPLAAALAGGAALMSPAVAAAALAMVAVEVASRSVPGMLSSSSSWEDVSGAGRRMPWRVGLLIFAFAVAAGLPLTAGFSLRLRLAEALQGHAPWVAFALVAGATLLALPVVRLALFVFAKTPRQTESLPPRPVAVAAMALSIAVGLAWPLLWRW